LGKQEGLWEIGKEHLKDAGKGLPSRRAGLRIWQLFDEISGQAAFRL
jgi:hypothetical protein